MWNFPLTPEQGSRHAARIDQLFFVMVALTVFFTLIVLAIVVTFAVKYRAGRKVDRSNAPNENLKLEIAWSVIPLILALAVFAWGAQQFVDIRTPPKNPMDVFVVGKQWMWHIQHANGIREMNELHVPVGVPVRLTMISQDVLHAFFIPEFRIQWHVVPGRYTSMWFEATKPGRYRIFCNVYCGTQHSEMGGFVYVMPKKEFAQWLASGGNRFQPIPATMAESGKQLFEANYCTNCHTEQDTPRGPSLNGVYGRTRRLKGGNATVADEAYLRESIINPYDKLNVGYDQTMPSYKDQFSEEELLKLIAYMKSLGLGSAASQGTGTQPGAAVGSATNLDSQVRGAAAPTGGTTSTTGAQR